MSVKIGAGRFLSVLRVGALPMMLSGVAGGCADEGAIADEVGVSQAALLATTGAATESNDGLTVRVKQGRLHGKLEGDTRLFLGIPYAKPPVGELRFALPQAADGWKGVREAVEFGPVCPQPPGALGAPGVQSEDCLSLNVYAPQVAKKDKLPVMVFIHGGAFVSGGSTSYDGVKLTEEGDVIVVTLNYRLGALGFLAHPGLDDERSKHEPSGNDAFRDQQVALSWVRKNIDAFGGDEKNVTVFGESAGGMSACLHMVSPSSKKLGDRFIIESASCVAGMPIIKKDAAQTIGQNLASALCAEAADPIACLREKPASEIVAWGASSGISGAGWGPVINPVDKFLPAHPIGLIALGLHHEVPFIIGSNTNEWALFQAIGLSPVVPTVAAFDAAVEAQFGPVAPLVKLQYPVASDAAANPTFVRLMTDAVFRCPARMLSRLTGLHGTPSYLYSFDFGPAYHAFELPYVFGNPNPRLGAPTLVEPLRETVQSYWTQFAKAGDPNIEGQPTWSTHNAVTDKHMSLKVESAEGTGLARPECDFWQVIQLLPT